MYALLAAFNFVPFSSDPSPRPNPRVPGVGLRNEALDTDHHLHEAAFGPGLHWDEEELYYTTTLDDQTIFSSFHIPTPAACLQRPH